MAAPATKASILNVRLTGTFVTPPGTSGFANLVEPDDAFDKLQFKLNLHMTEDQAAALGRRIDTVVVDPLWPKFMAEVAKLGTKAPKGGWEKPSGAAWVDDHLKDPKEGSRMELPFIVFANDAEYRDKKGVTQRKTMRATDGGGHVVDLKTAKMGMGTVCQALLMPSLWASALSKGQAALSFKLQGVRIIKLVQFGASGSSIGDIDEEDMGLLEADMEMDDLSQYARPAEGTSTAPRERHVADDMDDEIPF